MYAKQLISKRWRQNIELTVEFHFGTHMVCDLLAVGWIWISVGSFAYVCVCVLISIILKIIGSFNFMKL